MKGLFSLATILIFCFSQLPVARAFETDQYNLPPTPLADIGEEVSEYTAENIREAIWEINRDIEEAKRSRNAGKKKERLGYLRSEDAVSREVFKRLGSGFIAFSKIGNWMDSHKFRAQPARFKTGYRESIYVILPTNYFTISPTAKLYGTSMGTDKISHFFQQGYTYYRIFRDALAKGSPSRKEAVEKALKWGRMTEHTYYGTLVGGVFSNADLAANFAGMKFYEGLTNPITIGGYERPAVVVLKDGYWTLNNLMKIEGDLLKPFFSDHLNEALNPSVYAPGLRSFVRGVVRKRSCSQWIALYPNRTKGDFEKATGELELWHGEPYGYRASAKLVTIANTCFAPSPTAE